jgi:putative FmdB family regulatory protein
MPIYAYKCSTCGHAADVLQKISADPLTQCPACGASTYAKQVTAAGFALKGSGWYVTDFRGGNTGAAKAGDADKPADAAAKSPAAETAGSKDAPATSTPAPAAATPAPAAASTPATPATPAAN